MTATNQRIYTPRVAIDMILGMPNQQNKSVCTKIPYRGYEISIAMDSSHCPGDLTRSDIRVISPEGKDVTFTLLPGETEAEVVPATAEALKDIFAAIDEILAEPA